MNTFMFGGQSILDKDMIRALCLNELFKKIIDEISSAVEIDLHKYLLDENLNKNQLEKQLMTFGIQVFQFEFLHDLGIIEDMVYGYSIGDFAAMVCCKVLSVEDAAKIIVMRYQTAKESFLGNRSETIDMLSIHNVDVSNIKKMIKSFYGIEISNINTQSKCVVCGDKKDLISFKKTIKNDYKDALMIPIMVGIPFHTKYLVDASSIFEKRLHDFKFKSSNIFPNISGHKITNNTDYYTVLPNIMRSCANWQLSVNSIKKENNNIYECSVRKMLINFNDEILGKKLIDIKQLYFYDLFDLKKRSS